MYFTLFSLENVSVWLESKSNILPIRFIYFCSKIKLFTTIDKMIKLLVFCMAILSIGSLVSCNLPVGQYGTPTMSVDDVYKTVAANLTAEAFGLATGQPTETKQVSTTTPIKPVLKTGTKAVVLVTQGPSASETVLPCVQATAGHPIDITIPDGTRMKPGESFSKTWRLVNSGTCAWTNAFSVVWFSGEDIGITREQYFISQVLPGQSVDVTVDMEAPFEAGSYQSNWKLRDQQGNLFGIGPNGGAPFWAKIEVIEESTSTPTSLPSDTPTPEVSISGIVSMELNDGLDLDNGEMNTGSNDDIKFAFLSENEPQIQPVNGAKLASIGTKKPSEATCITSDLSEAAVNLAEMKEGSYLCYETEQGLPGYVRVTLTSLDENILTLEYLTWAIP
jgi:hypothetical protein